MLAARPWVPEAVETLVHAIADEVEGQDADTTEAAILGLVEANRVIHEQDCINLDPASNVMNPKAEALLASGLGTRPSLGYPGLKYETGREAIERIEVIAAELAAEVFGARFAELRVASGAMANLYAFMATTRPGDTIIVPPPTIGGHVTHQDAGAAGLYGLLIHPAPVSPSGYGVDVEALWALARRVRPRLLTIGGSLNLFPHPVREIRQIADEVGARLLYDAAHMSGPIAGRAWQQPLEEGAHLMTMSTYKSLGGPPAGLVLTNEPDLARRLEEIAFPGLTANFDAAKTAALAMSLLDWKVHGPAYGKAMVLTAQALARGLAGEGLPVFGAEEGFTRSHQVAVEAARWGGGQSAARRLRSANILACGIGLPGPTVEGDLNGLRLGTPEIVRRGMTPEDMPELARLLARALSASEPAAVADDVTAFRGRFNGLHFVR